MINVTTYIDLIKTFTLRIYKYIIKIVNAKKYPKCVMVIYVCQAPRAADKLKYFGLSFSVLVNVIVNGYY